MIAPIVLRHSSVRFPKLVAGAGLTGGFVAVALLSRVWTPGSPTTMHIAARLKPPLTAGLLGTDAFGRDILSMLMAGAWTSLSTGLLAILPGFLVGVGLGLTAAALRGWVEEAITRGADVIFAFPALISAIMIGALIGPSQMTAILAIGLFSVPVFIRVARSAASRVWALDFCLAAVASGKGIWRITFDHVLPNIAGPLAVQATVQLGLAILVEAGLGFLGLGMPPPTPSWGRMLADAQTFLPQAPWMALAPGLTIGLAVLGFNLLGDGLRDALDPRFDGRRRSQGDRG